MRILMLLAAMLLCSCDAAEITRGAAAEASASMTFFRHQQSGLCFAFLLYDRGPALATVPCEKVEHLLPAPPKPEKECQGGQR